MLFPGHDWGLDNNLQKMLVACTGRLLLRLWSPSSANDCLGTDAKGRPQRILKKLAQEVSTLLCHECCVYVCGLWFLQCLYCPLALCMLHWSPIPSPTMCVVDQRHFRETFPTDYWTSVSRFPLVWTTWPIRHLCTETWLQETSSWLVISYARWRNYHVMFT